MRHAIFLLVLIVIALASPFNERAVLNSEERAPFRRDRPFSRPDSNEPWDSSDSDEFSDEHRGDLDDSDSDSREFGVFNKRRHLVMELRDN